MAKAYKNILFDLDGTLSDSAPGILRAFEYAFSKMNRPLPSHETLISYIGPPIEYSLRDYFSPQELIEVRSHYREYYLERGMNENTLYKGIPELLTRLKAKGYNLYVATCKATYNARDILANFGIADCFIYIQGVEQGIFDKSGVIKKVMDDFNLSPSETLFVGDTRHDTLGAAENNIDMCFVTYGFGKAESVADLPVVYFAPTPEAVGDYLE